MTRRKRRGCSTRTDSVGLLMTSPVGTKDLAPSGMAAPHVRSTNGHFALASTRLQALRPTFSRRVASRATPSIPETSWDTHGAVSEAGNELTRPVDDSGARTLSSLVALVLAWRNYAVKHGPLAFAMVASSPCDYTPWNSVFRFSHVLDLEHATVR